jgi:hypothetical protein
VGEPEDAKNTDLVKLGGTEARLRQQPHGLVIIRNAGGARYCFGDDMNADDRSYLLRRAREEREAARIATCIEARERHLELAAAYEFRCRLAPPEATPPLQTFEVKLG